MGAESLQSSNRAPFNPAAPDIRTPEGEQIVRHLYVHVPFCPSICPYCDFHVLTRGSGLVERYLAQIEAEAEALAERYRIELDTVYLGGGTPSFLRDEEITALAHSVQQHLGWGRLENTLEINPGTVSTARAAHWRALGFDRASVGVQSLHNPTLKFLGRRHDAAQARAAVRELLGQGFAVSGDLITAVRGQPLEDDIAGLSELGVGHISAYTLTIEAGTEFARRGVTVSDEEEQRGFSVAAEALAAQGFERYEVSNYARAGQQSRHNLAYWQGRFYLGLGPSAAGHYPVGNRKAEISDSLGGSTSAQDAMQPSPLSHPPSSIPALALRRTNLHLHDWLAQPPLATAEATAHAKATAEAEAIGPHDLITDALFMGLRLRGGVNLADLSARSGVDVPRAYASAIAAGVQRGQLVLHGDMLRATTEGWWVLNRMVTEFLQVAEALQS